jgi:threonine dehydrogenase-like Zn-dependent dehydrogenase
MTIQMTRAKSKVTKNTKAEILDKIEVRYFVKAAAVVYPEGCPVVAHLSMSVTAGVYSGIMDKEDMADTINHRGIHEEDIDHVQDPRGRATKESVADMLEEKKLSPDDIISMAISEITLDEATIAMSWS